MPSGEDDAIGLRRPDAVDGLFVGSATVFFDGNLQTLEGKADGTGVYPNLIAQVELFQQHINAESIAIADRLWVKTHLKYDEEKLRVST